MTTIPSNISRAIMIIRRSPQKHKFWVNPKNFDFAKFLSLIKPALLFDRIEDIVAAALALQDPRTPLYAKVAIAISLTYFVIPLDAVNDFVPVGGRIDDLAVFLAAISAIGSHHITEAHKQEASRIISNLKRNLSSCFGHSTDNDTKNSDT